MTVKQFAAAVANAEDIESDEDYLDFDLPMPGHTDENPRIRQFRAYRPNGAQFAVLMAMVGAGRDSVDRVSGVINFLIATLEPDDADVIQARLLNRKDPFGLEQVEEIIGWMTEEWTGNPTVGPRGSTSSQPRTGPTSTRRTSLRI